MNTKWLAIAVVLFIALPLVSAARGRQRVDSLKPMGSVEQLVGQVGVDGLSALLIETHNPPPPIDLRVAGVPRARSIGASAAAPSVANRNRNPLNIKVGLSTRGYLQRGAAAVSNISPLDGGHFLKFDSPEAGFKVAVALLMSASYSDLDLDRVLRRWSNNGFGAEILAGTALAGRTRIGELGPDDLKLLLRAMATAEGYQSPTIDAEIARALEPEPSA